MLRIKPRADAALYGAFLSILHKIFLHKKGNGYKYEKTTDTVNNDFDSLDAAKL